MHAEDDDTATADSELMAKVWAAPVLAGPLPRFDPDSAPAAPGRLFAEWLGKALADGVPEPHIVTVSTAAADGTPSARVVMLRGIDSADCAVRFAGDRLSGKGRDISARPAAALTWYWPAHGRQIRMTGPVDLLGAEATRRDFLGRSPTPVPPPSPARSAPRWAGRRSTSASAAPPRNWSPRSPSGSPPATRSTGCAPSRPSSSRPAPRAGTCGCATPARATAGPALCCGHDSSSRRRGAPDAPSAG